MNLELHLLQNFAPSCLNRDDTNSPKDCRFGGFRRARISSQCIKRAIRQTFTNSGFLPLEDTAVRSKRLVAEIAAQLADMSTDTTEVQRVITTALASQKLKVEDGQTQYLLFLGRREIAGLVSVIRQYWDQLAAVATDKPAAEADAEPATPKKSARKAKAGKSAAVPKEVTQAVQAVLDGGKAADLALFGRMVADLPDRNIDAASQVAHAISTNKVDMEMDYFTAVDDLKTRAEDSGAGMLGTVEYNSSCFYRYANVNIPQLLVNLQGDHELAVRTINAFIRSSVSAIPTGKQNTFAAHNPPSAVLAVVRRTGFWSLANAFERPIRPDGRQSLVEASIAALDAYWGRLVDGFGADEIVAGGFFALNDCEVSRLATYRCGTIAELLGRVGTAVTGVAADTVVVQ
jgi:CRISPR system Cascade subunit CasC